MSALIRPTIDEYFMEIATVVAKRSTCLRNHVGALFVKNKRILSTGYNGAPSGLEHCDVVGCAREGVASGTRHELCRAVHAEQNAIIQAALHGISIEGATLYCTHQPCILCAKMMINARVARVVYRESYPDGTALEFLSQAGIDVERV
jgi:dCMP deaminase